MNAFPNVEPNFYGTIKVSKDGGEQAELLPPSLTLPVLPLVYIVILFTALE